MVDLTCRTPPYDQCLCEALESEGVTVDLWAAGCYSNTLYQSGVDVSRALDVMAHFSAGPWLTKRLKALEYVLNLIVLYVRVLLRPVPVIHFQWLPLLDVVGFELLLVKLAQQQGTRVVYTVHDLLPLDTNNETTEERRRFATVYRQVDALICHTKTSQERLVKEFEIDPSKIWRIPHGPLSLAQPTHFEDSESMTIRSEDVTGVSEDVPTVLLFGVLRPYKGYDFLLNTWSKLQNRIDDAQLVIVGSANDQIREEIESLVQEKEISESVSRTYRYISDAELHAVIDAADVLVYPYRNITQSGALFAGMEEGKAIIATDVGGLGETIRDGETGRLVGFGNHEQFADALVELLSDPEHRHRLGKAAREDLQTRLSWTEIAKQTRACYRALVGRDVI
ncbi:glycosyltransferase family 4 protein [Salinibacter ruber]|uniref:glycosyltransferase family 4 protein n=1 Tax=Salinibacter ruber TaxID=146919 RepID=UPI0020738008|nr:glycosyltransferase family 4 protein [Salinibacter ruber]